MAKSSFCRDGFFRFFPRKNRFFPLDGKNLPTLRVTHSTNHNIDGTALPVVSSVRDLGILVSHDLSPTLHISSIVCNAHKRSAAIYHVFVCRNVDLLVRAWCISYICPTPRRTRFCNLVSLHCQRYRTYRICPASIHKVVARFWYPPIRRPIKIALLGPLRLPSKLRITASSH